MKKVSLYIHWPFCRRICPYCDFNVRKNKSELILPLLHALIDDLRIESEMRRDNYQLEAIHFGGGTPSLIPPEAIEKLIDTATGLWRFSDTLQIALEANPEDVENFADIARAGVNRLSLGIQAFHDTRLQFLGRVHSKQQAQFAIENARKVITSLSADFIYGTAKQSLNSWQAELREITQLPLDHLSMYNLTIEPKTIFGKSPPLNLPHNDQLADMMLTLEDSLENAGFPQYEVSNFAPKSHHSRYNLDVWQSNDFIGIGPGAYGRYTDHQRTRHDLRKIVSPTQYASTKDKNYFTEQIPLSTEAAVQEWLIMGLRLNTGISAHRLPDFVKLSLPTLTKIPDLAELMSHGLLTTSKDTLAVTDQGRLQLDRLTRAVYQAIETFIPSVETL